MWAVAFGAIWSTELATNVQCQWCRMRAPSCRRSQLWIMMNAAPLSPESPKLNTELNFYISNLPDLGLTPVVTPAVTSETRQRKLYLNDPTFSNQQFLLCHFQRGGVANFHPDCHSNDPEDVNGSPLCHQFELYRLAQRTMSCCFIQVITNYSSPLPLPVSVSVPVSVPVSVSVSVVLLFWLHLLPHSMESP